MGRMKSWLEDISVEKGLGGEITAEVIAEGQRRLDGLSDFNSDLPEELRVVFHSPVELGEAVKAKLLDGMSFADEVSVSFEVRPSEEKTVKSDNSS